MRFHGLMTLRDEQDIVTQSLTHLLSWIDNLVVMDLGSTDGTWEIVQEFAAKDKRVVAFQRSPVIFSDNLRCILFDRYRHQFDPGDWIMRIDTDEFYHIPPPEFVKQRLRPLDSAVWLQWYFFRLVQSEVAAYENGQVDILQDRKRPIEDRRRYYKISEYAEPRMFRYRRSMQWPEITALPYNTGYVSRHRIPIRHYPHRDPLQMQTRFRLRAKMMTLKAQAGGHWKLDDWRAEIVDEKGTAQSSQGNKRGLAGEIGIDTGGLHYWEPNTPLKEQPIPTPTRGAGARVLQRLIHPLLLPLLDSRRRGFDKSYEPDAIPAEIQKALEAES